MWDVADAGVLSDHRDVDDPETEDDPEAEDDLKADVGPEAEAGKPDGVLEDAEPNMEAMH